MRNGKWFVLVGLMGLSLGCESSSSSTKAGDTSSTSSGKDTKTSNNTDGTDGTDGAADGTDGAADGTDGAADGTDGAADGTDGAVDGTDGAVDSTDGAPDGADAADAADGADAVDGGACDPEYHCAAAVQPGGGQPALLCPGSESEALFAELSSCVCEGPCAEACADSACAGGDLSEGCSACVQSDCGGPFAACSNDI